MFENEKKFFSYAYSPIIFVTSSAVENFAKHGCAMISPFLQSEFDADDSLSASRFVDAQHTTRNRPSTIAHSESVDDVIDEITVVVVVRPH